MSLETILLIDDEALTRHFITDTLRKKGFQVSAVAQPSDGLLLVEQHHFDLIIIATSINTLSLLARTKELSASSLIVLITSCTSVEQAVEAMRLGAFHYIPKPITTQTLEHLIHQTQEKLSSLQESSSPPAHPSGNEHLLIAKSPIMQQLVETTKLIAMSNANVLITGESGSGKELFAALLHHHSPRHKEHFVKVNCAAVPDTLIESEFFGHEKGAYTGAIERRLGRFELADQGSLLLDEVTEIPLLLQAKLLRVIQEQEFERVGGNSPIKVNVRLISTSNRKLEEAIKEGRLREDLYYRLNVIPLHLPALRDHPEDIPPLVDHFLAKFCQKNGRPLKRCSPEALKLLCSYSWPGNIRELANICERSVVLTRGEIIHKESIHLERSSLLPFRCGEFDNPGANMTLAQLEQCMIAKTLAAQNNNQMEAAKALGISHRLLRSKIERYNLQPQEKGS